MIKIDKDIFNATLPLLLLFFSWLFFSIFFGEHIPMNNGLGWDGTFHTSYAKDLYNVIINNQLSSYLAQRILPASLIYFASQIFHFSVTEQNAPLLFSILNVSMIIVSVFLWLKISHKLNWNIHVKIITFSGLFLNYANMKLNCYYPTLTDTTAFAIGFLMLYFYIEQRDKLLFVTTLAGAFTFPTMLLVGIILFINPINKNATSQIKKTTSVSLIITLCQAFFIIIFCIVQNHFYKRIGAFGSNNSFPLFYLSILALFIYLSFGFMEISKYYSSKIRSSINLKRVFYSIVTFVCVHFIIKGLANDRVPELTVFKYLIYISNQALAYPFNFIISHVLYFGPIVGLFLYFWREIVQYAAQKGLGLFSLTVMYFVLSIGSESRQLINFVPVAVFLVGEILNRKKLNWNFTLIFVLLSLFVSRFWLPLNHGEWPSVILDPETILQFPLQWYFMNFGPWVSYRMYFINSILAVSSLLLIYWIYKKTIKNNGLSNINF